MIMIYEVRKKNDHPEVTEVSFIPNPVKQSTHAEARRRREKRRRNGAAATLFSPVVLFPCLSVSA
jgi:hypothetical protein